MCQKRRKERDKLELDTFGMVEREFGEIPAWPVGSLWPSRLEVSNAGVHRPPMGGISGTGLQGADSIVVNGGYEDDLDEGNQIIFTGAGGNDPATKKQIADQEITQPGNAGLVTSQFEGLPVRVIRGPKGDKRYSPTSGFRYDGLYRVAEHWNEPGVSGFRIWRFRLLRLTDGEAAPYKNQTVLPGGKQTPSNVVGIVTRIVRDTKVSRAVKKIHDHRCQICDLALLVPGGSIVEGAHIRPLGKPHNGPDTPDNLLCLCPNHHALFDQGGIYITDDLMVKDYEEYELCELKVHVAHALNKTHLQYHRELWGH